MEEHENVLLHAALEGRTAMVHQLLHKHAISVNPKAGCRENSGSQTNSRTAEEPQEGKTKAREHGEHWVEFDKNDPRRSGSHYRLSTASSKMDDGLQKEKKLNSDNKTKVACLGRVLLSICKSPPSSFGSSSSPSIDVILALCKHDPGVLPAAVTRRGTTALMGAALRGYAAVCVALIEEGANIDATNDQDQTALSFAASRGYHEVVFALLDHRPNPHQQDHRSNFRPRPHHNIKDLPDTNGRTPLIHAASGGHMQCCELLLSMARARTDTVDAHGRTPLILAASKGHKSLCTLLVEDHGADVNQASTHGITPLMAAIDASHSDCAFLLMDRLKADVRRRNSQGACALTYACKRGLVGICVSLVQMGLEVDSANDRGTTALMVAANNGHVDICRFLLDQGADLDAVNADYATPVDCASNPEVNTLFVQWLQEHQHGRISQGGQIGGGRRIVGTREEEEGKQQRQQERERLWIGSGQSSMVNSSKAEIPARSSFAQEAAALNLSEEAFESKKSTEEGEKDADEGESAVMERNHHRERTLRAINEQHAMITHSFLGQKVDEQEIEHVNALLAERMAQFYDMCERDDGSGSIFLSESSTEHANEWQELLQQYRTRAGGRPDEPNSAPPAPPSHTPYQPSGDRELTNLHLRTITLAEEVEARRRIRQFCAATDVNSGDNSVPRDNIEHSAQDNEAKSQQQISDVVDGHSNDNSDDEDEIHAFNCPITQDRMTDPVTCMDGHTYERKGIERWLEDHDTSPLTGAKLPSKMLIPNHSLRHAIEEYDNARKGKK